MKLKDIFNKKVRDEKKKYKFYKLPDYVITSEFLNLFPDEEIRNKIYDYSNYDSANFITKENYNTLIELSKINKDFGIESVKLGYIVSQEELKYFKELAKYDFDFLQIIKHATKILEYKNKYGDIVIPYLKKDYNLYSELLDKKDYYSEMDLNLALKNPSESMFIIYNKLTPKERNLLLEALKNDTYHIVKKLLIDGFSVQIINIFKFYNYNEKIINLFKSKNIYELSNITEHSTLNQIGKLICDYNIYIAKKEGNLNELKANLCRKYFNKDYNTIISLFSKYEKNGVMFSSRANEILIFIKKVMEAKKIEDVPKESINFTSEEFIKEIYNNFKNIMKKENFKASDYKQDLIIKNGVKIIKGDHIKKFNMMVHVISTKSEKTSPNFKLGNKLKEDPELWENSNGSNNLCCSIISEYSMYCFGNGFSNADLVLGFDNFENYDFLDSKNQDRSTNMRGTGATDENYEYSTNSYDFYLPSELTNCTLTKPINNNQAEIGQGGYNEITLARTKYVKPSYILTTVNFDNKNYKKSIDEVAIKWAKFYDIPIVQLDGDILYKNAIRIFDEKLNTMIQGKVNIDNFDEFMKAVKIISFTKDKRIDILDVIINLIDKNINNLSVNQIEEYLKIINKYDAYIISEFSEKIKFNFVIDEMNFIQTREKQLADKILLLKGKREKLINEDTLSNHNSGFSI